MVSFSEGDGLDMVRFVDIRVSARLALAASVFTVSKENTFRFLACYAYQRGLSITRFQRIDELSRLWVLRLCRACLVYIAVMLVFSISYRIRGANFCACRCLRGRSFTSSLKMSWEGAVFGRSEESTKIFTICYVGGVLLSVFF